MKKVCLLFTSCILIALIVFTACTGGGGDTQTDAQTDSGDVIIKEESNSTSIYFNATMDISLFNTTNCKVEWAEDEEKGEVLRVETSGIRNRLTFNYEAYMKELGVSPVLAQDYPYAIVVCKNSADEGEAYKSTDFKLGYGAGEEQECNLSECMTGNLSSGETGWQSVVLTDADANWSGEIHSMLLSGASGVSDKQTYYIYSVHLYKTIGDVIIASNTDGTMDGLKKELTESKIDGVSYEKKLAPDEDSTVQMWFDHISERKAQNDTVSTGMNTYLIRMPGNSIEGCQFFLAPESERKFDISLTTFTDSDGNTMRTELFYERYFLTDGTMLPDALPPLKDSISVSAGNSQGFYIKVWANAEQASGLYTAELQVKDADTGKIIKDALVYTYVWDFSLSEKTAMKTAASIWTGRLYASYADHKMNEKTNKEIFKAYYDFLLENRVCADRVPYSLTDERVWEYLNDPRVNTFRFESNTPIDTYNRIRQDKEVFSKGYFYIVDEPNTIDKLNELQKAGEQLKKTFPDYRMISPFFTNLKVDDNTDQIKFMQEHVSIWDTKVNAFTPRKYASYPGVQYLMTPSQEKQFGSFEERMAAEVSAGDELWVYYCCSPAAPYVNWMMTGDGTEPIVSVWQCRNTKSTGILYWSVNWWTENLLSAPANEPVWGDGVLLHSGAEYGMYEPISSLRLENIRDGIQDYQMLYMIECIEGAEAADEITQLVSVDVLAYTSDDAHLHAARVLLGEKVESLLKKD